MAAVDVDYGVYTSGARTKSTPVDLAGEPEPNPMSFSAARFAAWLALNGIPWPQLESGALALDDGTFRQMAKAYPIVAPLRELRHTLGEMRLESLAVGADGRNRCLFRARSARPPAAINQATRDSSSAHRAGCGGLSAQRRAAQWPTSIGLNKSLASRRRSGDQAMMQAYSSGDPYLTFAKQAGAVPMDATKQSHSAERERFKVCSLAVQYLMGSRSLSQRLGQSEALARELLRLHRTTYPTFWRWSDGAINQALLNGRLWTVFGWTVHVGANINAQSLANFPVQANGAEMLRLACCLATRARNRRVLSDSRCADDRGADRRNRDGCYGNARGDERGE